MEGIIWRREDSLRTEMNVVALYDRCTHKRRVSSA